MKFKEYIEQFLGLKLKNKLNFIDLRNQYIDILGRKVSRKSLALRSSNFIRFRRTAKKAWTQLRKDKDINYQTAKSFIGRYGAIKNSNTKHFRKKYHIPYILKRCEAKISKIERRLTHANNEIQFATAWSFGVSSWKRNRCCNLPERVECGFFVRESQERRFERELELRPLLL